MPIIRIDDVNDPRLTPYRDLPKVNLTRASGRFIAEGRILVQRLLASRLTTESILCDEGQLAAFEHLQAGPIGIYLASSSLIREIVGFRFHRGALACGQRPANPTLDDLQQGPNARRLLVVCPQIVDPTNLAGVIRNCSAFGVDGLLLGEHCADPYSRRVVRVSMGTVFRLPVRMADNLLDELRWLGDEAQYERVGTVLDPLAQPLWQVSCPRRLALLVGNEGHGLDDCWLRFCDQRTTLPMQNNTDSLNLATASGIFLYHFTHVAPWCNTPKVTP